MPEPENEATLQATANLSPVSPSPVHSAAVPVVPALQETVDTIDAMVAAAAAATTTTTTTTSPNDHVDIPPSDHNNDAAIAPGGDSMEDVVDDDDSFNEAYGQESYEAPAAPPEQDSNDSDDYAKTFDSPIDPIDPGEGQGPGPGVEDAEHLHVSSVPRESNNISHPSGPLATTTTATTSLPTTTYTSDVPHLAADSPSTVLAIANPSLSLPEQNPPNPTVALPSIRADDSAATTANSSAPHQPAAETDIASQQSTDDIQQLVADLTAESTASNAGIPDPSSSSSTAVTTAEAPQVASTSSLPSTTLPSPSSLPPRPPLPQITPQSYASQHHPVGSNSNIPGDVAVPLALGQSSFVVPGAPGTSTEAMNNLPPPPAAGLNAQVPGFPMSDPTQDAAYQHHWDQFMGDERQYMSEAKWDRFPEGSRIFIGNLSSDKVSKRDVFDIFHKFGRLAQISLKSAYGFVQYHTVEEGRKALEELQGIEVKGRRIHLEISRVQEKTKKERNRSPDRSRGTRETSRRTDKYGRDDNRASRNHSPRRKEYHGRNDSYSGGDRGYHDSGRGRGRSRSPGYRREKDYRRRSPSPYGGRSRHDGELEIPRRYGSDVPDVQIIMQPDVSRDFATWVEGAFKARGLKTAVMFLHPRIPKDQVIQRQAAEGVLAVVDLDIRSQGIGKIPIHSFDRSGGIHNVRFEQYVDLDPSTAAEVILRAKGPPVPNYSQPYGGGVAYPSHHHPYGAQPPVHATGFPAIPPTGAYPPPQQQQQQQSQAPAPNVADLASLLGRVDNATLQQLLAAIPAAVPQAAMPGARGLDFAGVGAKPAAPPAGAQVDIQALLGSLSGNPGGPQHHELHPQDQYGAQYKGHGQNGGAAAPMGTNDAAAQVQNIMAQLARYRQ